MQLHRFVIGIQFNKRMFRLPSLGGLLIDEVLSLRESDKKIKDNYFTQVSIPVTKDNEYTISLIDDNGINSLEILPDQFRFKKTSIKNNSAVNVDKTIQEFEIFWKAANKIITFPAARRIGFVGEFRISEDQENNAGRQLIDSLTKFNPPENCSRFKLTFEDRDLTKEGSVSSIDTDDFWNKILTFYISDTDETPEKGKINANMDLQKYFNPAKANPLKELNNIKNKFIEEKVKFKKNLNELGLSE